MSETSFANLMNALDFMEAAIKKASIMRLLRSTHLISELRQRKNLLQKVNPAFNDVRPGEHLRQQLCRVNEDSTAWEEIQLKPGSFEEEVNSLKSKYPDTDIKDLYLSGPLATYARSLQLVTDFLNNDRSIPASYPEQNLNRALNQFTLLEKMEEYLLEHHQLDLYSIEK
ncbi:MAG: hypothetical protein ABI151_09495 [Chitinophagaceae bacterium]